jgi:hypothetical protein
MCFLLFTFVIAGLAGLRLQFGGGVKSNGFFAGIGVASICRMFRKPLEIWRRSAFPLS